MSKRHEALGLIDYFAVLGMGPEAVPHDASALGEDPLRRSPLRRTYRAHVVTRCPRSCPWNSPFDENAIAMLCFPRGLRFVRETDDRRIRFHTFVITKEDGSRVYGANLQFYELIENPKLLALLQTQQAEFELAAAKSVVATPRTALPTPPRAVPAFDPARHKLYAPTSICLLSQVAAVACMEEYLRQLYLVSQLPSPPLPVEMFVANLIYETPMPPPGKAVEFACTDAILFRRPPSDGLPLFEYSLHRAMSLFTPQVFIQLYTCALLEKQIILRSRDLELLVLTAECLTGLLYPFAWQHVYVPILPSPLLHFLEAPVPFIMGLHIDVPINDDYGGCVVNIDSGDVRVPDDMPAFPSSESLCAKLATLILEAGLGGGVSNARDVKMLMALGAGRMLPPAACNPGSGEDFEFTALVRQAFLDQFVELLLNYQTYLLLPNSHEDSLEEGATAAFDKITFLSDQPISTSAFLVEFMETQMFASFIDAKGATLEDNTDPTLFDRCLQAAQDAAHLSTPPIPISPTENLFVDFVAPLPTRRVSSTASDSDRSGTGSIGAPDPASSLAAGARAGDSSQGPSDACVTDERRLSTHVNSSPLIRRKGRLLPAIPKGVGATRRPSSEDTTLGGLAGAAGPVEYVQTCGLRSFVLTDAVPELDRVQFISSPNSIKRPLRRKQSIDHLRATEAVARARLQSSRLLGRHFGGRVLSLSLDTHDDFAAALLEECALKVKKIVLLHMDALSSPSTEHGASSEQFENTMVANLCDLLERIWRHGARVEGKSALWAFLQAMVMCQPDSPVRLEPFFMLTPPPTSTPPAPRTQAAASVTAVGAMHDLRGDVGRARAWVRLALERKTLSLHLGAFLSRPLHLEAFFKSKAFLMNDDHRDQLLIHLLALTTVDLITFTPHYPFANMTYHVAVHTAKGFRSGTSANVNVIVNGSNSSAGPFFRPKGPWFSGGGVDQFEFSASNLGGLKSVTVAHDDVGLLTAWVVDRVVISNLLTGGVAHFPFHHRRLEDTTPCEAVAASAAELEALGLSDKSPRRTFSSSSSTSSLSAVPAARRTLQRHDSPGSPVVGGGGSGTIGLEHAHDLLTESVATAVNALVRHYHQPEDQQTLDQLGVLLLGPRFLAANQKHEARGGSCADAQVPLAVALANVFASGFKTKTTFGSRHIWDYVLLAQKRLHPTHLASDPETLLAREVETANGANWPKSARFEWLVCAGASHRVLHVWFDLLVSGVLADLQLHDPSLAVLHDHDRVLNFAQVLRFLVDLPISVQRCMTYVPNTADKSAPGHWRFNGANRMVARGSFVKIDHSNLRT